MRSTSPSKDPTKPCSLRSDSPSEPPHVQPPDEPRRPLRPLYARGPVAAHITDTGGWGGERRATSDSGLHIDQAHRALKAPELIRAVVPAAALIRKTALVSRPIPAPTGQTIDEKRRQARLAAIDDLLGLVL